MTRETRKAKLIGIAAAGAALTFLFPGSASAGPGEWDYVGSDSFYWVNGNHYSHEGKSHGGDFKACIETSISGEASYALYEADPGYDEMVGSARVQVAGGCEVWSVGGVVDGDNNTAELYIATTDDGAHTVRWYD